MTPLSPNEREVLRGLYAAGMTNVSVKTICDYLPDPLHEDRGGVSSRLCKLRGRNLVYSEMVGNVNLWTMKDEGMAALRGDSAADAPDISPVSEPAIPEPAQPDRVDISADIPVVFSTAGLPDFGDINPPVCADLDARPEWPDVSEDLLEEASSLFLMTPFPRLHDALYVLHTLAEFLKDRPAMAYELERVAAYLVEETP